jgi:hypothetical protein
MQENLKKLKEKLSNIHKCISNETKIVNHKAVIKPI